MPKLWRVSNLSRIPGVEHAFVADCGDARGDELVALCRLTGGDDIFLDQQHTATVLTAERHAGVAADGATTEGGERLWIRTADCLPILLATKSGSRVAALHAGWRGVLDGIVGVCLNAWSRDGIVLDDIAVAIGPHILASHFEVGPELADRFAQASWSRGAIETNPATGRPHIDLSRCVRQQMHAAGIPDDRIETVALSTVAVPELASYRRDKSAAGRNWAYIRRVAE